MIICFYWHETQIYTLLLLKINDLFEDNDQIKKPYQDLSIDYKIRKVKEIIYRNEEIIWTLDYHPLR